MKCTFLTFTLQLETVLIFENLYRDTTASDKYNHVYHSVAFVDKQNIIAYTEINFH